MADLKGRCLCGGIEISLTSPKDDVCQCHCAQCRQWAGHNWASVSCPVEGLKFDKGEDLVQWYRSSEWARRGFCRTCGSSLFYHADRAESHKHKIAVAAGCLDAPTGLKTAEHIFCGTKGDYYEIADDLPKLDTH
ncbi:GFA family protein [Aestuariispira insulae]|uniref:CENP-V/GFA domain-containing protein n=1 Tax=Aestuariispira insulae TaxID=1461337 RepID=A0A3D9HW53_9PROT|nr:GFA family protein [Aestuariispira insulae]RED53697.1 hypothetical protein DFP90_101490 [Aestuariispira insulae]